MSPPDEEGRPLAGTPSDLAAAAKPPLVSASIVGAAASRGARDARVAEVVAKLGLTEAEALQFLADTDAEIAEAERLDDEREADEAAFLAMQAEMAALVVEPVALTDEAREAEKARIVEAGADSGAPAESLAEVVSDYLADCKAREVEVDPDLLATFAADWSPEALAAEHTHRLARIEGHLDEVRGEGPLRPEWLDRFRFLCTMAGEHLDEVRRHFADGYDDDARLAHFVQTLLTGPSATERNAPVDWATLWAQADEPVQWLAEPLVEAGTSVALYSPPKVGKSLLALDVCAGIATGRRVLGKPAQAPRRVLYLDAENTPRDLVERLTAMGYSPDDLDDRFAYVSFPSLPALDTEQGGREFVALLDKHRPDLVVLDTVSRFVQGDENDARTYADLYRLSLVKAKQRGIAVLRLDHAGKDVAKGQRGSSAKSADVDTVWRLELVSERDPAVRLTRDVTRNGHGEGKVLLARIPNPLRHVPTGKAVLASDDAVALEEMTPNVRRLVEALQKHGVPLGYGRDKAGRALNERGVSWSSGDLSVALKTRSSLADPMGSDLSDDLSDPFGQVSS
jgi:hypothetical protein